MITPDLNKADIVARLRDWSTAHLVILAEAVEEEILNREPDEHTDQEFREDVDYTWGDLLEDL